MLKGKFLRQYRSARTQNMNYVYTVKGTPEEIAEYEEVVGDRIVHNEEGDGEPLFFSSQKQHLEETDEIDLVLNRDGERYSLRPDEYTQGVLGAMGEVYKDEAKALINKMRGGGVRAGAPAPQPLQTPNQNSQPPAGVTGQSGTPNLENNPPATVAQPEFE